VSRSCRLLLLPLVLLAALLLGGCATTEPENESVLPWNTPKNWEGGMPGGMMEGR
jgi:hypothetical protein